MLRKEKVSIEISSSLTVIMIEHCAVQLVNCTFTTVQKVLKEEVVADVSLFKSNGRQVDLISVSVPL